MVENNPLDKEAEKQHQNVEGKTNDVQNSNSLTKNKLLEGHIGKMEVHQPPKAERKPVKQYLLEGLMIFIAVLFGFFADNLREHFAEVDTTHDYLDSYKQELESHKKTIQRYDSIYSHAMIAEDSMTMLFYNKKENENLQTTGRLLMKARKLFPYSFNDAAYRQLVNAGGLKYIHKPELKEAMSIYAGLIQHFQEYNQIKYADRSASLPELNALDDLHNYVNSEEVPQMNPYPRLTNKERRFIVSFYRQFYLQFYASRKSLARLKTVMSRY